MPNVPNDKPPFEGAILVTITKLGDGQVSTGVHVAAEGDVFAKRGDKMWVSKANANSLEVRGFAESD